MGGGGRIFIFVFIYYSLKRWSTGGAPLGLVVYASFSMFLALVPLVFAS